ncbi:MAG: 6-phosphofructokinase [Candidatus Nanopelagicales bacterium]
MSQPAATESVEPQAPRKALAVLTSGGDAQGMNAVVRATVRTAIGRGADVYAIYEGLQGLVDGGDRIKQFGWSSVSSIQHLGGTVIGTARSMEFRERAGRLKAAKNLVNKGIDRLVVIGGDGSLTGTDIFRAEWSGLLDELVATGEISAEQAQRHSHLVIAGVVGSIDNDMVGTDKTVGADSALHRIIEDIDALASTASSHQRSFVVEVMGRHCGYLALLSAIAGGADYVLIPEMPPGEGWQDEICERLRQGRAAGRRDNLVIVAEGVTDQAGNPITSQQVANVITERLGEDTRLTILGHVQRGGTPSAYDRWMPTLLGHAAALEVLNADENHIPQLMGVHANRVVRTPLMEAVASTRKIPEIIASGDYAAAAAARGSSFTDMLRVFAGIAKAESPAGRQGTRIAILHAGGLAPGMNPAVRAAVRFGNSRGHDMLAVRGSFQGLIDGNVAPISWGDVEGWVGIGGAELGTSRSLPDVKDFYAISRALENNNINGLLVIGGHKAYEASYLMQQEKERYPGFKIPLMCLPASIDNNLPGWEVAIGADTALNAIVECVDRLKQSAMASRRAFVVEVMGRYCGYLAMLSALSVGAEKVYLHEEGVTLSELSRDVEAMVAAFHSGRNFHLSIRNEESSQGYTTAFLTQMFTEEAHGVFDVRPMILGHLQQGGNPSPFDRVHAARLAAHAIDWLTGQILVGRSDWAYVSKGGEKMGAAPLRNMPDVVDNRFQRPFDQWWMSLRGIMEDLALPATRITKPTR